MSSAVAYSIDDIKSHKAQSWVAIHDKVYNLDAFKAEHPGGKQVIEHHSGTDASKAFDNVGHPKSVAKFMVKFEIGTLKK